MELKTLYKDDYVNMSLESNSNILIDVWTSATANLSQEHFKELLLIFKDLIINNQVKYVLTDTLLFELPMSPTLQQWTLENITLPLTEKSPYSRHAFIMPQAFISNLAIEQFTDENNTNAVATHYFSNIADAKKWLVGDK